MNNSIKERIENLLEDIILSDQSVSGGCIADSRIVKMKSGRNYFLKQGFSNDMFHKEANSLRELGKPGVIKVPDVVMVDNDFLLLECISSGKKPNSFYEEFGRQFARLHKVSNASYGFYEDNYIGASPQYNIAKGDEKTNWTSFYLNKRLMPQVQMAKSNGYYDREFANLFEKLSLRISDILQGSDEPASLLHGDLWSGNYMVGSSGEPVVIDPAVYYGHREADLAMTKLFGGYPASFYNAYNEEYPLQSGSEYRLSLYMLYHVLNHLNLFRTGYYGQVISILKKYVS